MLVYSKKINVKNEKNERKNIFMMNLKKVLMLFLLSAMLWFSFMIFPQTRADLIDNRDVDIIQGEVDIEYESNDFEDLGESDDLEDLNESDDLEDLNELNIMSENDEVYRDTLSVIHVSNHGELINAVNSAPTDGTLRTIIVTENFTTNAPGLDLLSRPGSNIVIRSDSSNPRTITAAGTTVMTVGANHSITIENIILQSGGVNVIGRFIMNDGAVIQGASNSAVNITNSNGFVQMNGSAKITNNTTIGGGGGVMILVSANNHSTFEMNDSAKITGNTAIGGGGGVFINRLGNSNVTFEMNDSAKITGNTANNGGGVLLQSFNTNNERMIFEMNDSASISDNTANLNGGGIHVIGNEIIEMNDSASISDNTANLNGGGISFLQPATYLRQQNLRISENSNVTINNNVAGNGGGGIYVRGNTTIDMESGKINNNRANIGGGILLNRTTADVTLNDVNIIENEAILGGGIAVLNLDRLEILDSVLSRNEALGNSGEGVGAGGGFFWQSEDLLSRVEILRSAYIAGNTVTGFSPEIFVFNNSLHQQFSNYVNPSPWDGVPNNHAFNEVDIRVTGFQISIFLQYNFEGSPGQFGPLITGNSFSSGLPITTAMWNNNVVNRGAPIRAGYHFDGWSFDPTGEIITANMIQNNQYILVSDMNLYAQWTPNEIRTITFDANGGTIVGDVMREVRSEQSISNSTVTPINNELPIATIDDGRVFSHWATNPDGSGDIVTVYTPITHDTRVYAQWEEMHDVTFMWNYVGNTNIFATVEVPHKQSIATNDVGATMPDDPTRAGYTFTVWSWKTSDDISFEPNVSIVAPISLYARWTTNPIRTITFDLNGGTIDEDLANVQLSLRNGQSISNNTYSVAGATPVRALPTRPERAGYIFNGWQVTTGATGANASPSVDETFTVDTIVESGANITVTAQWEANPAYLDVSIPTTTFFQSNHIDATQLESLRFTITNNSIVGLHVDVADFTPINETGMNLIRELDIQAIATKATPIRLIADGLPATIPTDSRLLALPGSTDGSFEFRGSSSNATLETEVKNPSFNLLLRFEVANIPSPFVNSN